MCGKDLCKFHSKRLALDIYNPRERFQSDEKPNTLKLTIEFGSYPRDTPTFILCDECTNKFKGILYHIKKGNIKDITKGILNLLKEYAKVEAIWKE